MISTDRPYQYKISPSQAVVVDMITTNRQQEHTVFYHLSGGLNLSAKTAKVKYDRRGEGYFLACHRRVYLSDLRALN